MCEPPRRPGVTLVEVTAIWRRTSWAYLVQQKNFPPAASPPYARSQHTHERAAVADLPGLPANLLCDLLDDPTRSSRSAPHTIPRSHPTSSVNWSADHYP
jgi:hypothetical protein